jgi:VanZ family protein
MKLEEDKKQHIVVMFILTIIAAICTKSAALAGAIALAVGIGKEIYDHFTGGVYSMEDMAANSVGIFAAMLIFLVAEELWSVSKE